MPVIYDRRAVPGSVRCSRMLYNPMLENYLIEADLTRIPALRTDVLVLGSGVAGLSAALTAARTGKVIVAAKAEATESNTFYARSRSDPGTPPRATKPTPWRWPADWPIRPP
jgi:hypothetical protein